MKFLFFILFFFLNLEATIYTDMFNVEVDIKSNKRIVCLGPGTLRLVKYLNLEKRLVGIEKRELNFNPNSTYTLALDKDFIKSLPLIGQGGPAKMPNLESLIILKPDIIFASFLSKEQINLIKKRTKVPVVALSYGQTVKNKKKLDLIKESLTLLGNIMDRKKRVKEILDFMNQEQEKLLKVKIDDSLIYIGGLANRGIQGITSTESDYPPFEILNINNKILKQTKGHTFINNETFLYFNPKTIFLDTLSKKLVQEEIKRNRKIFKNINAFKNKRVYWLYPSNYYNINVENIFINSWIIASKFKKDIDIEKAKKRVYKSFYKEDIYKKINNKIDVLNVQ